MDDYFKSIVEKYMRKNKLSPTYIGINPFLARLQEDNYLWSHWFYNCRMFHESPCEKCEYRFRCYTS